MQCWILVWSWGHKHTTATTYKNFSILITALGIICPWKLSSTTKTISDLWSKQCQVQKSLQNRYSTTNVHCPLTLRVLEQLSSCRLFLIWVSRQIFQKKRSSFKSLLPQFFPQMGWKPYAITKGAHLGQVTILGHQLLYIQVYALVLLDYFLFFF